MVRFSDLSGEIIPGDDGLARIVIHEHPQLGGTPVEIEVLADEARTVEKSAVRVAVVDLYLPGEDEPRRVAMDVDAFDALATDKAMTELLATARPVRRSTKSAVTGADRGAYASLEQAGKPHKGKITEAERRLVREHFDEINERLAAEGLRAISLADAEHVERYGLADLAERRGARRRDGRPSGQAWLGAGRGYAERLGVCWRMLS